MFHIPPDFHVRFAFMVDLLFELGSLYEKRCVMRSWDEISDFYKTYADGRDTRDIDFGNGMLDLIHLLRNDPDINLMSLGTMMNWLVVALPETGFPSVHIQWSSTDTYEIFLTPEHINQKPDSTIVNLNEAAPKVKEYLSKGDKTRSNHPEMPRQP